MTGDRRITLDDNKLGYEIRIVRASGLLHHLPLDYTACLSIEILITIHSPLVELVLFGAAPCAPAQSSAAHRPTDG